MASGSQAIDSTGRPRQPRRKLSVLERAFLDIYVGEAHYNGVSAMRILGRPGTDAALSLAAQRVLRRPLVKRHLERLIAGKIPSNTMLKAELADIAMSDWRDHVQVRLDNQGQVIGAKLLLGDKIRAIEVLGKATGALSDPVLTGLLDLAQAALPQPNQSLTDKRQPLLVEALPLQDDSE